MQNSEIRELFAAELPFWDKLSEAEITLLLSGTKCVHYKRGENIHSPSNECLGVLLVRKGELRTYILSEDGKEVTLFRLGANEACILSATCVLSSISFDVFIDTQEDTDLLLINSSTFAGLQKNNVYVENYALRLAAERFSDVMWTMEQILFLSLDARLAVFLIDECSKTGASNLTLTHEQIAKYIGSAREAVSRMLKYFEKEGYVRLHRGGLEIINKSALKQLSQVKNK